MKLYAVQARNDIDIMSMVDGIFSTKKKAKEYIKECKNDGINDYEKWKFDIYSFVVDEPFESDGYVE